MDQKSRAFAPGVVVVPVGSAISFPNSDSVSHQVYSFSPAKKFQLPLYRGKAHPPVLFDRPGAVTLGCNIHDQMRGFVFVTEGQYSGRTDTQGTWTEASVQPGEYKVTIWHPGSRDAKPVHEQNIVVTGGTDAQKFTLQASAALRLSKPTGQRPGWDEY
jgi:hypothetical protein